MIQLPNDHLGPTQRRTEIHEAGFLLFAKGGEKAELGLLNGSASTS